MILIMTPKEFDESQKLNSDKSKMYEADKIGVIYHDLGVVLLVKDRAGNIGKSLSKAEFPEYFL
jgi:hypothetical protein